MMSSPDRSGTGEPTRGSAQRCSTVIACLRMSGYYTGDAAHPLRGSNQYPALLTCRCRREMVFHRGAPERSAPSRPNEVASLHHDPRVHDRSSPVGEGLRSMGTSKSGASKSRPAFLPDEEGETSWTLR